MSRIRSHPEPFVCALLFLLTALVYAPVAGFPFVDFDDPAYVAHNPIVEHGLTAEGVRRAFGEFRSSNWHPLTWISHMLDVSLFGMNAGRHHAVSALLHALNACLLFWVLARMTRVASPARGDGKGLGLGLSAVVAALFALHPAHVESVAWVAERKDTLAALFWILAMAAYLHYVRAPSLRRYLGVFVCLLLSLLSKPMAVTLPGVLWLLDLWPLGRLSLWSRTPRPAVPLTADADGIAPVALRVVLLEKLPLLALVVASSAVTIFAQRSGGALKSLEWIPLAERIANVPLAYARYLGMAVWPQDLAVFYPALEADGLSAAGVLPAVALLFGLSSLALWQARTRPFLLVGWLWFLGTLVPVIGLVQVGDQSIADRYTYLPYVGLSIALVWGVESVWPRHRGRGAALALLACAALAAYTSIARRQVDTWRDAHALWAHALAVSERSGVRNGMAHYHLSQILMGEGELENAYFHALLAVDLHPDVPVTHQNVGTLLHLRRQHLQAGEHFERALELDPDFTPAMASLGEVKRVTGDYADAVVLFEKAVRGEPALWENRAVRRGFARALISQLRSGQRERAAALDDYRRILRIHPRFHRAAHDLALTLALDQATGEESREAVRWAEHASRQVDDRVAGYLYTLSLAQAGVGDFAAAVQTAGRALDLAREDGDEEAEAEIRAGLAAYRSGRMFPLD